MTEHKQLARAGRRASGSRAVPSILCFQIAAVAMCLAALSVASAQQVERTKIIEWGHGGNYFEYICGSGRVLTGLQGSAGVLVDSIQAVCGRVEGGRLVETAQAEGPVFGNDRPLDKAAGCATGVTRIDLARNRFDPYVGAIVFSCPGARPGQSTEIRGSGELEGVYAPDSTADGRGGLPSVRANYRTLSCPEGTIAIGIRGRAGRFVDAFGLVCRLKSAAPSPLNDLVGQEVSFQSYNYPDRFIRHRNSLGFVEPISGELGRKDAGFRIVPGLGGRCASFESLNYPGHFLRHHNFRLKLARRTDEELFRQDATFCLVAGLADSTGVSLESINLSGHYIRHRNSELWLNRYEPNDLFRKDATFRAAPPGGGVIVK